MTHYINPLFYLACCHTAMGGNKPSCPDCKTSLPYKVRVSPETIRLGDIVRAIDGHGYVTSTVKQINPERRLVTLFRPYVATSNFTYTAGVICYIGIEEYSIYFDTDVIIVQESTVPEVVDDETDEGRLNRSGSRGRERLRELRNARVEALKESL